MSNTPSTPVVRVQRGALLFVVVILTLGALILAASGSTTSSIRGNVTFVAWSSSDNAIYLEHPADWAFPTPAPVATQEGAATEAAATEAAAQPGATDYPVSISNDSSTQVDISLLQTAGLDAIKTELVSANKLHNDAPLDSQPIVVGNTHGLDIHQTRHLAASVEDTDAWVVPLDPTHAVVAWIQTTDWRNLEPVWMHVMSTLRVDRNAGLRTLGIFTATPTPTPTQTATPAGTGAATAGATAAATTGTTAGATPTAAAPTVGATSAATGAQ